MNRSQAQGLDRNRIFPADRSAVPIAVLVFIAGLTFDLMTPLGVASGISYTVLVLLSLYWPSPYTSFVFAAIATSLTIFGYFYIEEIQGAIHVVQLNRLLAILAHWMIAFMVYKQRKTSAGLAQSESRLRAVLDGTFDGIITINGDGAISSFNASCETLFGYSADEVMGKNVKILMPEPYRGEHDGYLANYKKTGKRNIIDAGREVKGARKNGSVFPLDLSVTETRINGQPTYIGVVRDITEQKNARLEREAMIEKLERSNQELDQFAYVASHDLKAPLRVIDNASRWLQEDLDGKLDEECLENMELLRNRVARMERLLDDLLEYSRIGRQTDARYTTRTAGDALMKDVLLLVEKPETFDIKVSPEFSAIALNTMPVQQIFVNLINNSIKHHDKDTGRIEVSVEDRGDRYLFSVRDDGPGIDPKFHEQIFSMFQTLKPRDRVEGSGMGLAMIHKHVKHFGETISVVSAEGQGADFRFTWPKHQRLN